MEYLQYSFLESVKDGMIFSPKYDSTTKFMEQKCHVVVMCNELPDISKLSRDRYKDTLLGNGGPASATFYEPPTQIYT